MSHIGLGVTAAYTAKTLRANGYQAIAKPIFGADDLGDYIRIQSRHNPVSHVLIMAQWIPTKYLALLTREFPEIVFGVKCHSGVGFLQAEPPAINLIREAIDLETGTHNFHFCSNNIRLCHALKAMYGRPISYLPNLYYLHGEEPVHRPLWNGGVLKIGAFGSHRIYKNFSTAIAASIEIIQSLKCHGEIWINAGRSDGAGNVVFRTAKSWTDNLPNVALKELQWASWSDFKRFSGSMNLLMQPSYTETFNNVTADGIAEGVCCVVGDSIEWVPDYWKADPDNSSQVAGVGRRLLFDPLAASEGYDSLLKYVKNSLPAWATYFKT